MPYPHQNPSSWTPGYQIDNYLSADSPVTIKQEGPDSDDLGSIHHEQDLGPHDEQNLSSVHHEQETSLQENPVNENHGTKS